MLSPSKQVDARLRIGRHIVFAHRIGVDQRGGTVPVFRRIVQKEQLGYRSELPRLVEQRGLDAGDRITFGRRRERKVIRRVAVVLEDTEMPRRHRKTVVETPLPSAGNMDEGGVENGPASRIELHAAEQ